MKLHPFVFTPNRIALLLLGVLGSQSALAITIPGNAQCYSNNGGYGYDAYIANNSAFGELQAVYAYNNGSAYYETGTGTFATTPPASVNTLNNGTFCYSDKSSYEGNYLAYSVGSSSYAFNLQFWGDDQGPSFYLNLNSINNSVWTTSGVCPGETNWAAAISANNTSTTTQTICNEDYVLNIATANTGGSDNGATLTITDNPAGNASGSQSSSSVATASAQSRSMMASAENYGVASRIFKKTRWSLIRDPATQNLSGMIYAKDGRQFGSFVHCTLVSDNGNADPVQHQSTYNCATTDPCTSGQCGETWQGMTEAVILPGTFFDRPPTNNPKVKLLTPPVGGDADIRKSLELLPTVTERRIHQTPDGKVKVLSVNLLKQEWLLAYDGQHLFAAVPHNQMGQPRFVQCNQTAETEREVKMDCLEAYRCHFGPCTDDQWSPVASITLPKSLLSLPVTPTSSGGGGCVLTPNTPFDPLFPALSIGALWYLGRRRRQ